MHLPSPSEIAEKIRELGLDSDGSAYEQSRAEAVREILAGRQQAVEKPTGHVLSRSTVAIADGYLEITVTHHPSEGTAPA